MKQEKYPKNQSNPSNPLSRALTPPPLPSNSAIPKLSNSQIYKSVPRPAAYFLAKATLHPKKLIFRFWFHFFFFLGRKEKKRKRKGNAE